MACAGSALFGIAGGEQLGADRVGGLRLERLEVGRGQPVAALHRHGFGADDRRSCSPSDEGRVVNEMPLVTSVLLAMSQALVNLAVPSGSNWTEQVLGSVTTITGVSRCASTSAGIGRSGNPVRSREIEQQRKQHAADHHRLAADPVAEPAEKDVERRADDGHDDQQQVLGLGRDAERLFEEHLQVEEGEIPDGALRAHDPEEGDQHALEVPLGCRTLRAAARVRQLVLFAQPGEMRGFRRAWRASRRRSRAARPRRGTARASPRRRTRLRRSRCASRR